MFPVPLKSLGDKERHDYVLKTYVLNKTQNTDSQKYKRDIDIIRENHRFLWESSDTTDSWEKQLARRYYDKLFKEYCISDLSQYKENKVALRWRVEAEVISGKGQFQCGNRKCEQHEGLKSWEVNFAYLEEGQRKNALVKLRLCPEHSIQLNYTSRKREIKRLKRTEKNKKSSKKSDRKRRRDRNDKDTSDGEKEKIAVSKNDYLGQPSASNSIDNYDKGNYVKKPTDNMSVKKLKAKSEQNPSKSDFEQCLEDLLV